MSDLTMLAAITRILEKYDIVDDDLAKEIETAVNVFEREDFDGE